jgi:Holliday junction resolvase RusA-like endonuclease
MSDKITKSFRHSQDWNFHNNLKMAFVHKQSQKWSAKITDIMKQKYIGVSISHNRTLSLRAHHKIVASEINAVFRKQKPKFDPRLVRVGYGIVGNQTTFHICDCPLAVNFASDM